MGDILLETLRERFGHEAFKGEQRGIIERVMAGRSTLAVMPTGGGKSLTYQLPAVMMPGVCVVVSPLIALMQDQLRSARGMGLRAASLTSADEDRGQTLARLGRGELDLLYVAPERAVNAGFLEALRGVRVCLFAIDEAHCVSEWGHDFRPDYRRLGAMLGGHDAPVLALTASADAHTRADIAEHFGIEPEGLVLAGFDRPNIHYALARRGDGVAQVRAVLAQQAGAGIVYCRTRAEVERMAAALDDGGRRVWAYHAGMTAEERARHQAAFFGARGGVMVATIAFGMGVDKADVRFVVHVGLPRSVEAYYQETGRAGRDGGPALALMLWGARELVRGRQRLAGVAPERLPVEQARWRAMERLVRTWGCRRGAVLRYFGEERAGACGNCDRCAQGRWLVAVVEWGRGVRARIGGLLTGAR